MTDTQTRAEWIADYAKTYRVTILQLTWELRDILGDIQDKSSAKEWARVVRKLPDEQLCALVIASTLGFAVCKEENLEKETDR